LLALPKIAEQKMLPTARQGGDLKNLPGRRERGLGVPVQHSVLGHHHEDEYRYAVPDGDNWGQKQEEMGIYFILKTTPAFPRDVLCCFLCLLTRD
jgi:hypothetical protein